MPRCWDTVLPQPFPSTEATYEDIMIADTQPERGFIAINRALRTDFQTRFNDKRTGKDCWQLFEELLTRANYFPGRASPSQERRKPRGGPRPIVNTNTPYLERGDVWATEAVLAAAMSWSRPKIHRELCRIESDGEIVRISHTKNTAPILRIVRYEQWAGTPVKSEVDKPAVESIAKGASAIAEVIQPARAEVNQPAVENIAISEPARAEVNQPAVENIAISELLVKTVPLLKTCMYVEFEEKHVENIKKLISEGWDKNQTTIKSLYKCHQLAEEKYPGKGMDMILRKAAEITKWPGLNNVGGMIAARVLNDTSWLDTPESKPNSVFRPDEGKKAPAKISYQMLAPEDMTAIRKELDRNPGILNTYELELFVYLEEFPLEHANYQRQSSYLRMVTVAATLRTAVAA